MMKRLAVPVVLGGILAASSGTRADDPPRPTPAPAQLVTPDQPKIERTHYVVRHADPVALAAAVGKHFRGEADIVAAPAGSGNALLISGSRSAVAEVVKLLAELDRKPATVEVEVVLVEVAPKKDAEPDLSGDALAKVDALIKSGQATSVQRIKLTAVEDTPVTTMTGGNKPFVSGTTVAGGGGGFGGRGGGGPVQRTISYSQVGTTVKLTARVTADNTIAMDLDVQESKVRPPEAGDESGAVSMETTTLVTKLAVPSGKGVAARTRKSDAKSGSVITLVVITARVVDAKPKNK